MAGSMLDSMEDSDPGVVDELGRILEKHPELYDKMVVYNHTPGQDAEQQS